MKREVRKDFNLEKRYSVDVSNCTGAEKKWVQQAFFDVGIRWMGVGKEYRSLDAESYSNAADSRNTIAYLVYSHSTKDCNMTAEEFLDLVYEPEQKGHVQAEPIRRIDMKEINDEIKLTLNLMQTDIDDGAHGELQGHLHSLLEIKRNEIQKRLVERSWGEPVTHDQAPCKSVKLDWQITDNSKPLTVEELRAGWWWLDEAGNQALMDAALHG